MERITNDRDKFIEEIKRELFDYKRTENWTTLFEYVEMPFFLRYAYSVNFAVNKSHTKYSFLQKTWNAAYDLSRFNLGVFNIDRLAVTEAVIDINMEEQIKFSSIINKEKLATIEFKGIILDGLICELKMPTTQQHLKWNIDEEMNEPLSDLVNGIRIKIAIS